ncbi:phosphohistidine phosphatase [Limimonas halophila]|uniref:Phosphohistidine phosphatase n=1 Tax=Limimonas halophila TaxID=1082479 RepID=A0A1G7P813_9PROT|nr:histidine phosphatase family protein [Limimonas halophila]SDF82408.1 phosphohistidine phosphatase [Limimonas halophila]
MKTLYLLRHAKSAWDDPALTDHERPLAPRGEDAAPRVGRTLRDMGAAPDRVLCSSARRARQTWALIAPELDHDAPVEVRDDLYDADATDLLDAIHAVPAAVEQLIVVGHNPSMERLAEALAGDGNAAALQELHAKYPTGAVAELRFDLESWDGIESGRGHLTRFHKPKKLPDPEPDDGPG